MKSIYKILNYPKDKKKLTKNCLKHKFNYNILNNSIGLAKILAYECEIRKTNGLAAPQLGFNLPVIYICTNDIKTATIVRKAFYVIEYHNKGKISKIKEKCLSYNKIVEVDRYDTTIIQGLDILVFNKLSPCIVGTMKIKDNLAIAVQHELDHLEGKGLWDYI